MFSGKVPLTSAVVTKVHHSLEKCPFPSLFKNTVIVSMKLFICHIFQPEWKVGSCIISLPPQNQISSSCWAGCAQGRFHLFHFSSHFFVWRKKNHLKTKLAVLVQRERAGKFLPFSLHFSLFPLMLFKRISFSFL